MAKNEQQRQLRLPQVNQLFKEPYVYAVATLAAVAVYIDISRQESMLAGVMSGSSDLLLDLGERGLFTSARQALNCDSDTARLIINFLMLLVLGYCCRRHWISRARRNSVDLDCPSPAGTKSFTERLSPEEYELQKMETTRLALENLTGSEEFKRHEAKKKEQRRRAVSKSLVYEQDDLDESIEEAGPPSGKQRHNQTIVHAAGAFGDDSSDLALSAGQKRKGRRERNLGFVKGDN